MSSDRKDLQKQHHGGSSITQDSQRASRDGPGNPGKPYKSGANVHKGSGGKQSEPAPASQPHKQTY